MFIKCSRHPDQEADYHCPRCEKAFCSECARKKKVGDDYMYLCPLCDNGLTKLAPYKPLPPFWRALPEIMNYPFHGAGWVILIVWPLFGLFVRGAPMVISGGAMSLGDTQDTFELIMFIFMHAIFYVIYFVPAIPLFHQIIKNTIFGEFGFEKVNFDAAVYDIFFVPILEVLGPLVGVFWPAGLIIIFTWQQFQLNPDIATNAYLAAWLFILIAYMLFGVFIFPIAFLCMSAFRNLGQVFNPVILVKNAWIIKKEYLIFTGLICSFLAGYGVFVFLWLFFIGLDSFLKAAPFFLIDSAIQIYLIMLGAQMLGYMAYQTRYKLKWWGDTQALLPDLVVDGQVIGFDPVANKLEMAEMAEMGGLAAAPAVGAEPADGEGYAPAEEISPELDEEITAKIEEGRYFLYHGNYKQAAKMYGEALAISPKHFGALHGVLAVAFRIGDHDAVREHGKTMGAELVRQHAMEALWDTYKDYKDTVTDFCFNPPETIKLADWLEERDLKIEAARLLREMAVVFPDDDSAPAALLRCAEILWKDAGKTDNAKNVFTAIIERYPDSETAERAKKFIQEMGQED